MSELDQTPGGCDFMAKSLDELASGDEQLYGVPGGATVRLRMLRVGRKGAGMVLAVGRIEGGGETSTTYYGEHEARQRFAELVDEITH